MSLLRGIFYTVKGIQGANDLKDGKIDFMSQGESALSLILFYLALLIGGAAFGLLMIYLMIKGIFAFFGVSM